MLIMYGFCNWNYLGSYNWISATIPRSGVAHRTVSECTQTCEGDWFLPYECMQKIKSEAWLCCGCNAANPTYIGYKCRQDVHDGTSMEDSARWWPLCVSPCKHFKTVLLADHASRVKFCDWLQPHVQILPDILFTASLQFTPGDTV
jgi:hypothetical protein